MDKDRGKQRRKKERNNEVGMIKNERQ